MALPRMKAESYFYGQKQSKQMWGGSTLQQEALGKFIPYIFMYFLIFFFYNKHILFLQPEENKTIKQFRGFS